MKKYVIIIIILSFFVSFQINADSSFHLEYLWEITISPHYFPVGHLSLPVLCKDKIYENLVNAPNYNCHNIYDAKTGQVLKSTNYPPSIDSLGLYTNGKQVVYVHEQNKKIIIYDGLNIIWEKVFNDPISQVSVDTNNIFILTSKNLMRIDISNKKIHNIFNEAEICINNDIYSNYLLNDKKYLYYFNSEYLFKINKNTYEIEAKMKYVGLNDIVLQNDKYLFSSYMKILDKKTDEIISISNSGRGFTANDKYIVYTDDNKLITKNIKTRKIVWEKEFKENNTLTPTIKEEFLYIYLEKFYVINVNNGNIVWEDKIRDDYFEYVPQIIVKDNYVSIFIDNRGESKLRMYRKY